VTPTPEETAAWLSRRVYWPAVNKYLADLVAGVDLGPVPVAGTPAWMSLPDNDPRKLLALARAGEHHVLRCCLEQEAADDASKAIAAAEDWPAVARQIHAGRGRAYVPRRPA